MHIQQFHSEASTGVKFWLVPQLVKGFAQHARMVHCHTIYSGALMYLNAEIRSNIACRNAELSKNHVYFLFNHYHECSRPFYTSTLYAGYYV